MTSKTLINQIGWQVGSRLLAIFFALALLVGSPITLTTDNAHAAQETGAVKTVKAAAKTDARPGAELSEEEAIAKAQKLPKLVGKPGAGNPLPRPLEDIIASKYLSIFVYDNFPPYSYFNENKQLVGVDVEIGIKMAETLGVTPRFFIRDGDESVDDDLRNNVWKGHYVGGGVADVMMHVPVDNELRKRNTLVVIFGRYYTERMSLILDPKVVGTAETLAPFLSSKIGVELDTLSDFYLSSPSTLGGRIRSQVVRYRDFSSAMDGLKKQEVAGLMGPRGQVEAAAAATNRKFTVSSPPFPGMTIPRWHIGMAVSHQNRALGYKLGDIILALRESGELKKIFNKYGLSYYKDFLD